MISEDKVDFKFEFLKFAQFWRYYIISFVICFFISYVYLRYTVPVYKTTSKIKILENNSKDIPFPSMDKFMNSSNVNLENELELIVSYPILEKVVDQLNLSYNFYENGDVITKRIHEFPFYFKHKQTQENSFNKFIININDDNLEIYDVSYDTSYIFANFSTLEINHELPFDVKIDDKSLLSREFTLSYTKKEKVINFLKNNISAEVFGNESEIIYLSCKTTNKKYSENILSKLIDVYNNDGIEDKRYINKRTIDFINERYNSLSIELDSIEIEKEIYKKDKRFLDFKANSALNLNKDYEFDIASFESQNQLELTKILKKVLIDIKGKDVLPQNLDINNDNINSLIADYNKLIIDKKNLSFSAGKNNISLKLINEILTSKKQAIVSTINNYIEILEKKNAIIEYQNKQIDNDLVKLTEGERVLRTINRSQNIKESIYLFLLEKREEAIINYAVTEPTIKVVEFPLSLKSPITPNTNFIYLFTILMALMLPTIIIYLKYLFDTKIHSKFDIEEKTDIPVIAEVPFYSSNNKLFSNPNDRSIVAEASRMLMSNVRYLLPADENSKIIIVTSSIKGEGKTLTAINMALSFASLNKKILLIGCDLRNPQLHQYINKDKNVNGLVDFLYDNKKNWKENVIKSFENLPNFDILLSGPIPPNPLNLINNGNIEILLEQAKKEYDYIIIDSAPTILVADTQSILNLANCVLLLVRSNFTDKSIISHINKLNNACDPNIGIILNGVGEKNSYGYSYKYGYQYGYKYSYAYNYGYGYGYSSDDEKS